MSKLSRDVHRLACCIGIQDAHAVERRHASPFPNVSTQQVKFITSFEAKLYQALAFLITQAVFVTSCLPPGTWELIPLQQNLNIT
jgi:hypothetical protein